MTSITYIGIDVHSTNYTLCAFSLEGQKVFGRTTINPDIDELLKYLATLQGRLGGADCKLICGYEAGCLGYTLYRQLTYHMFECVICHSALYCSFGFPDRNGKLFLRDRRICFHSFQYSQLFQSAIQSAILAL